MNRNKSPIDILRDSILKAYKETIAVSGNEVEVRFTTYNSAKAKRFTTIPKYVYDTIISRYSSLAVWDKSLSFYKTLSVNQDNNTRLRVIERTDTQEQSKSWIVRLDKNDFGVAVVGSKEVEGFTPEQKKMYDSGTPLPRFIERTRFSRINNPAPFFIDVSKVTTDKFINYEVELELDLNSPNIQKSASEMAMEVANIYNLMYNTLISYSEEERVELINFIATTLHGTGELSRIPRPQELSWNHLTGNTLLGETKYLVTTKVDGVSAMLIIREGKLWIISYNKYSLLRKDMQDYEDAIIYGELVGNNFYFTDLLYPASSSKMTQRVPITNPLDSVGDDRNISKLFRDQSVRVLFQTLNMLVPTYRFVLKTYVTLDERISVFNISFPRIIEIMDLYGDKSDGLVFIPDVDKVNDRLRGSFKWKEPHKQSIDLKVLWKAVADGTNNLMFTYITDKAGEEIFDTNFDITYLESMIKELTPVYLPTGTIIEFGYSGDKLRPIRIRDDKTEPNHKRRVLNIYKLMMDPITRDTLLGRTTRLMRKYHNRMKREMYSADTGSYNVEIGFGRGGDISKVGKYLKVLAIEPDDINYQELTDRLSKIESPNVTLLKAGVQDTELIEAALRENSFPRVDTISIMLSASFFWGDIYPQFIRTMSMLIAKGAKRILMFTIDGYAVRTQFANPFAGIIIDNANLMSAGVTLASLQTNDKGLYITIHDNEKGTIMREGQQENLVFVDTLVRDCSNEQTKLYISSYKRANTEELLNQAEYSLTKLYTAYTIDIDRPEVYSIPMRSIPEAILLAIGPTTYDKLHDERRMNVTINNYLTTARSYKVMIDIDGKLYNKGAQRRIVIRDGNLIVSKVKESYRLMFPV